MTNMRYGPSQAIVSFLISEICCPLYLSCALFCSYFDVLFGIWSKFMRFILANPQPLPVALYHFRPGVPQICFTQILKICLTQMLNNLEPFLSNAKSERRVFQMFGVQALPPLPSPHCAKKGHLWSSADKKGAWGVFYKKEKQTRAVSALGELPYTPNRTPPGFGTNSSPKSSSSSTFSQ